MRWPVMVATIAAAVTAEGWPMLDELPNPNAAPYDDGSYGAGSVSAVAPAAPRVIGLDLRLDPAGGEKT